jgi:predicted RecB family nuclease
VQRIDGRLIYSASDLNDFLECEHLTELERRVAFGELVRPEQEASAKLLATKGEEHERRYLEALRCLHGDALIEFQRPENTVEGLVRAEARTVEAMERGAKIIYQATFFDGTFVGHADFLERIETPSARFPWSYEVIDTKLALKTKPYYLVQLCNYSEHVARITGTTPEHAAIVLGNGRKQRFRMSDYAAYYRHLKASFLERVAELRETYPLVCKHCQVCRWAQLCERRRDQDDHLSIVAGMRRGQLARLEKAGIPTLAALAAAGDELRPTGMAEGTFANLRTQAQLQHRQRHAFANGSAGQKHFYEFREAIEGDGFYKLPQPAPGDLFFDIEGDPLFRPDQRLEYLFGVYLPDEDRYQRWWAKDPQDERRAYEAVMDFFAERLQTYPQMHVYHYAAYEATALKRLAGRFASRGELLDRFLRRELFVDLYTVIHQGLWASQPGYSLKKMEAFYNLQRTTKTLGGDDSIVMFEAWLESRDDALLEDIERYNADDCRSTYKLRQWLLARRDELGERLGAPLPWRAEPAAREPEPEPERSALETQLLHGLPPIDGVDDLRAAADSVRGRWLLGHLLSYHRREAKPEWWKYFDRTANPNDLEERDHEAIGGLEICTDVPPYKVKDSDRSLVYTYRFPPQDHHLGTRRPIDPHSGRGAGELLTVDDASGRLEIKLNTAIAPAELRALIPGTPLPATKQRGAIERVARAYVDGRLEHAHPATNDLLLGRTSSLRGIAPGAAIQPTTVEPASVSERIAAVDASYLFIQGPPGSGKSSRAARAITDLLEAGKRVGILAASHRAIHALLHKVEAQAQARGLFFEGCHKHSKQTEDSEFTSSLDQALIASRDDGDALVRYQLGSGTSYAWCDDALGGAYDYLFIDEAGQVSLADALGASLAARNIVLLGDPLQLKQVSQAAHPIGTEGSILQHLLGDDETIRPERGIFLNLTYRMQPEICEFVSEAVYEDRLHADESTRSHRVDSPGLSGAGLRFVGVEHGGNTRKSPEEAGVVAEAIARLVLGTVTLDGHAPRAFAQNDVLVVAPYNAQRTLIGERLKALDLGDVRVGTVDKFQGQEAPVVFYSLATSSGEDIPREMEFLFEKNRLNVAISRAQCMTVLVCSPRLLEIRCKSAEEMALANLLCLYAERATRRESVTCSVSGPDRSGDTLRLDLSSPW